MHTACVRCVGLAVFLVAAAAAATGVDSPAGHWNGAIEIPGSPLAVTVDLAPDGEGWQGNISIPAQGARDLPLADITVDGSLVVFSISGVPGEPTFSGTLEGADLAGEFSQGGQRFGFKLTRSDTPAALASSALEGLDDMIGQALIDFGVPGLGLGVVVDGKVVLAGGYGLRDVEAELPVTADTLFAIGSATKAFTTFVLGTLVDEGLVDWDEPVRSYLPEFRLADEHATAHLTVRDLVSHRSGLPRHDLSWYGSTADRVELMARLAHIEPFADLRERYHYQNLMFLTAGVLIERVTGDTWEEAVRGTIFEPLGMAGSNFAVADSQAASDHALPYHYENGATVRVPFRTIDAMGPAGSINSSINDMVRWLQLHLGEGEIDGRRLIHNGTLREMHTPQTVVGGYPEPDTETFLTAYGLGWFIESYRGHYRLHHGGGIDGFVTMVSFLPREGIGVVTLTNASGAALSPLLNQVVIDRLLGETGKDWLGEALERRARSEEIAEQATRDREQVRVPGTTPAHPLGGYAGEYANPGYGRLEVALVDDHLELRYNSMSAPLEHWHYEVFEAPDDGTPGLGGLRLQFRTSVEGRVDAVLVPMESEVADIVFLKQPDRRFEDPAVLERFTGVYELSAQRAIVSLRGNRLQIEVPGQQTYLLTPVADTTFALGDMTGFSVTFVEEDDRIVAVRFNQPNGVFTATRVKAD